jgi:chromate transporter
MLRAVWDAAITDVADLEPDRPAVPPTADPTTGLGDLVRVFTWLGLTAFGGPAAHIAILQREFVERRHWLSRERFVDLLGLSSLLPGPTSTEMALGIGFERGRWAGLLLAGLGFILPAALIVLAMAVLYSAVGDVSGVHALLYGMSPVVIAVIGHAMIRLVPTAFTDRSTWLIGLAAFVASVAGFCLSLAVLQPLAVLLGGALLLLLVRRLARLPGGSLAAIFLPWGGTTGAVSTAAVAASLGLGALFLLFLKLGVVVFGSGYVLVAFLGSELVTPGYLTEQELLDAIAIGQLTPGPVFTTATFVGYLLAGIPGAVVATIGIFLPAFVLVGAAHPYLPRLRANATISVAIDGLNAAAVGIIGASIVFLGRDAFFPDAGFDALAAALALGAFVVLLRGRIGPVPLLLGGAVVGLLARTLLA